MVRDGCYRAHRIEPLENATIPCDLPKGFRLSQKLTNRLIESLPRSERAHLLTLLIPVPLPVRTPLFHVGEQPRYIHLITSGMASVVTSMPGGDAVEVGLAGCEGFPEAFHILGPQTMDTRSFMQVGGTALRVETKRFREEFEARKPLRDAVLRLVQFQSFITSQLAACNRLHNVEQRLARWLLMVSDRVGSPVVQLTQEFLGEMIGARRATITVMAGNLQRAGLVEYRRGVVNILDHPGLEAAACECYPITRKLLTDLYR